MSDSSPHYTRLALILGDCLFPNHGALEPDAETLFFMAEDSGLCTHYRYHKQKLVLFLSAMRSHAVDIKKDHLLEYRALNAANFGESYEDKLAALREQYPYLRSVVSYQIEDRFFAERIEKWCRENDLELVLKDSPKFLFSLSNFGDYLMETKKPFLNRYYQKQRKALKLLLDEKGEPLHGKWSMDHENRKKLPPKISIPSRLKSTQTKHDKVVLKLVEELFPNHPGSTENFNWSTTRASALAQLRHFLDCFLENFGPYEDAFEKDQVFLFHSVLSPYLNMGLLLPEEVVQGVVDHYHEQGGHYPSVEGMVRQIVGWREFIRGMYHHYDMEGNHFGQERRMKECWYRGDTGIPPLDDSIAKVQQYGYAHHIERLMVQGSLMLMSGLHPQEAYCWFMEMYVDSADWVMAPNVFGMSQYAMGGLFATKPYLCGSNYLRKMSHYPAGDWCDIVDGLYWRFIDMHRETFAQNQRMSMMLATLRKINPEKRERIFLAAEKWIDKVTQPA